MTPPVYAYARLRRRSALAQAESWAEEWDRIKHKVPKGSRAEHPTFKVFLWWIDQVPYLKAS